MPKRGKAVVTGASRGIGAIYGDCLARRGYGVVLASRDMARMGAVAERLRASNGRSVELVRADLSRPEDITDLADRIERDASINLLVNNAGIVLEGSLLGNGPAELAQLIAVNLEITVLSSLGHYPHLDSPRQTIEEIQASFNEEDKRLNLQRHAVDEEYRP